jgi:hypothetical protein
VTNNQVGLEWEPIVIEEGLLVLLVHQVFFQSGLMINACHSETSGDTKDDPLLERIVVAL